MKGPRSTAHDVTHAHDVTKETPRVPQLQPTEGQDGNINNNRATTGPDVTGTTTGVHLQGHSARITTHTIGRSGSQIPTAPALPQWSTRSRPTDQESQSDTKHSSQNMRSTSEATKAGPTRMGDRPVPTATMAPQQVTGSDANDPTEHWVTHSSENDHNNGAASPPTSGDTQLPSFMVDIDYPHAPDYQPTQRPDADDTNAEYMEFYYAPFTGEGIDTHTPDYKKWPFPAPGMHTPAAQLYDRALQARLAGHPPPRVDSYTTLNIQQWRAASTGHRDDELVLHGIQFGFSLQYKGPPRYGTSAAYNHASATNYPSHVTQYFKSEAQHGALEGPFAKPPFVPWFYTSPMMTREKAETDERRIIVDLSYPEGGVNAHIAPHRFNGKEVSHTLPTIESAVSSLAAMCPGDIHMSVIDLSRAYRHFPVDPLDWPLLGLQWHNTWAFDRRLPFGARMSPFVMQKAADFIIRALTVNKTIGHMYLDDIILLSPTAAIAKRDFHDTVNLLHGLGLQVAQKKLQPPSTKVKWLGIDISVDTNTLSIPEQKLAQIKASMAAASRKRSLTVKHLQRLVGLANHLAKVVRAARIFVCRLLAALRATTNNYIIVTPHVRADLEWFVRFLKQANGRAIIPQQRVVLRIWADACLAGAGASDGKRYYKYSYPPEITAAHHITQLEAMNCMAAVRVMVSTKQEGGTVEVYCDNRPAVDALTSGRAKDPVLAGCARAMWFHAACTDTDIAFTHVPGEGMGLPDALSRAALDHKSNKEADRLIKALSLRPVNVSHRDFAYNRY